MAVSLKPLDQQVVVITGASSGIGLATAEAALLEDLLELSPSLRRRMTPRQVEGLGDEDRAALTDFESYFDDDPAPGPIEADRFEALGLALARYEHEHHPMPDA